MRADPGRLAVVVCNLGGPDRLDAVRPFLFNLFNDPAVLRVPQPFRLLLAALISRVRTKKATAIYEAIGGGSPILPNTEAQARALETRLRENGFPDTRVFTAMRHWQPTSLETALAVAEFAPDRLVLLPLYPQWSTTTSASSVAAWKRAARAVGPAVETVVADPKPDEPGFVRALLDGIRPALAAAGEAGRPRLLLSAHGLPKRVVDAGDPYPDHCRRTVAAVVAALGGEGADGGLCYQSRVGPLEWIGPSTEDEIRRAGADRVPVVLVPISFVSEHSETLYELDIEYRRLAAEVGVPRFERVAAPGVHPSFIEALAEWTSRALGD